MDEKKVQTKTIVLACIVIWALSIVIACLVGYAPQSKGNPEVVSLDKAGGVSQYTGHCCEIRGTFTLVAAFCDVFYYQKTKSGVIIWHEKDGVFMRYDLTPEQVVIYD